MNTTTEFVPAGARSAASKQAAPRTANAKNKPHAVAKLSALLRGEWSEAIHRVADAVEDPSVALGDAARDLQRVVSRMRAAAKATGA